MQVANTLQFGDMRCYPDNGTDAAASHCADLATQVSRYTAPCCITLAVKMIQAMRCNQIIFAVTVLSRPSTPKMLSFH